MSSNLRVETSMDYEQDDFEQEQRRQRLLAKRAEMDAQRAQLDAELALLQPSSSQSSFQHHRSPIYKQSQQRRSSNVPRSMSSNGVPAMSRHLSSVGHSSQLIYLALISNRTGTTCRSDLEPSPNGRQHRWDVRIQEATHRHEPTYRSPRMELSHLPSTLSRIPRTTPS